MHSRSIIEGLVSSTLLPIEDVSSFWVFANPIRGNLFFNIGLFSFSKGRQTALETERRKKTEERKGGGEREKGEGGNQEEREGERCSINCCSPQTPTTASACQTQAKILKLNPGLPHEWKRPNYLSNHLLTLRVNSSRRQESEAEVGQDLWHSNKAHMSKNYQLNLITMSTSSSLMY